MRRFLLLIASLTLAGFVFAQTLPDYLTPDNRSTTIPALYTGDSVFADYNGDGRPDLFLCGSADGGAPTTVLMENRGSFFQLAQLPTSLTPLTDCAIAVGDWNNDALNDLVMIGAAGSDCVTTGLSPATLFHQQTAKGFEIMLSVKSDPLYRGSANVLDFDKDGNTDVFLTGANLNPCDPTSGPAKFLFSDLFQNTPTGTLTLRSDAYMLPNNAQGLTDSSVDFGDLDKDGLIDIVACGALSVDLPTTLSAYSFIAYADKVATPVWTAIASPIISLQRCAVKLIDYDADGDLDVFITGDDGKVIQCQMLTNTYSAAAPRSWRDDSALRAINIACVRNRPRIIVADFDKDGLSDLVLQGDSDVSGVTESWTTLYMNRPYNFTSTYWERHNLKNISTGSIASADYNLDSYPDLYITGRQNLNSAPENQLYLSTVAAAVTSITSSLAAETTFTSTSVASLTGAGLLESTTGASAAQQASTTAAISATAASLQSTTSATSTTTGATSTSSTIQGTTTGAASISTYATTVSTAVSSSVAAATSTLTTGQAFHPAVGINKMPLVVENANFPDQVQYSGDDTELKLALSFRVRITKVEEEDQNGFAWPSDNPCPVPTQLNTTASTFRASTGDAYQLKRFTTLCNGAQLELLFTRYAAHDQEQLEFAGEKFSIDFGQIKMQGTIRNWPFSSTTHRLRVQTQVTIDQDTPVVGEQFFDSPSQPFIWFIEARTNVFLQASLIRNGLIDGIPTPLNLSPSVDGPLRLDVRMPWFASSASWDPKFEALLDGQYPHKKSKKGLKIGIPVAVGACFLIVLIVGLVFFIRKHMDSKTPQTDVPSREMRRLSNKRSAEESSVI